MLTIKDVEEMRNLMKRFKGKSNLLVQLPNGKLRILNKHTGNLSKLPDGKDIFDK